jgi:predicted dienelactone hydrolase
MCSNREGGRYIGTMKTLLRLLISLLAAVIANLSVAAPQVIDTEFRDAARERTIPIRIRIPEVNDKVPLVIFSHGLGGSIDGGKAWGEHWSANGYFVINVQHPGSDIEIGKQGLGTPLARLKRGANAQQLIERTKDVRFVLDEVTRLQRAGDMRYAKPDLNRIAMTGHSFGAMTTVALAGMQYPAPISSLADPRFKAFIAFSPQMAQARGDSSINPYAEIKAPLLTVTGTIDGDMIGSGATPERRAAVYDALPPGNKYRVIFENGDHMVFNGGAISESVRFMQIIDNKSPRTDAATSAVIQEKTKLTTLAFLDAYLKNDTAAKTWLTDDAAKSIGATGSWSRK